MRFLLIVIVLLVSYPAVASITGVTFTGSSFGGSSAVGGGSCTDGVDCFCDLQSGDVSQLFCEDFESIDLYENTSNDWVTNGATAGDRGLGSYWADNYGQGSGLINWNTGEPASPKVGNTCTPSASTCGNREYCSSAQSLVVLGYASTDCWDGNDKSMVDIQRADDFSDEIGSLTLTGGAGSAEDVGSGNQHLAMRVQAGEEGSIIGSVNYTNTTELGVTYLAAYSSNLSSISLIDDPWKHDEYGDYPFSEYWFMGNIGLGSNTVFPFRGWFFKDGAVSEATCDGYVSSATISRGQMDCNSSQVLIAANSGSGDGLYTQSSDWPFGTWGCVRAHIKNMGTSDVEIKIYFNEELLIDIDGFNGAALYNKDYDEFYMNPYANANQGLGETASTATGFRYQDNMYLRAGAPLSCADAGFTVP